MIDAVLRFGFHEWFDVEGYPKVEKKQSFLTPYPHPYAPTRTPHTHSNIHNKYANTHTCTLAQCTCAEFFQEKKFTSIVVVAVEAFNAIPAGIPLGVRARQLIIDKIINKALEKSFMCASVCICVCACVCAYVFVRIVTTFMLKIPETSIVTHGLRPFVLAAVAETCVKRT